MYSVKKEISAINFTEYNVLRVAIHFEKRSITFRNIRNQYIIQILNRFLWGVSFSASNIRCKIEVIVLYPFSQSTINTKSTVTSHSKMILSKRKYYYYLS